MDVETLRLRGCRGATRDQTGPTEAKNMPWKHSAFRRAWRRRLSTRPAYLLPTSPWNLVVHSPFHSLTHTPFRSLQPNSTQCSGSPASSLFYSSHSLSLSSTGRHVSPLTRTSTSSLSVLVARIGMLALRTSGPLVSSLNSISNRPPTLLRWPNVEFSIPSNSLPQPLVQPTSQPVAARQYFFISSLTSHHTN